MPPCKSHVPPSPAAEDWVLSRESSAFTGFKGPRKREGCVLERAERGELGE